jgi:glutathione S-transferase
MSEITLFHTPGACSRVTLSALEEIGIEFRFQSIDIGRGEHNTPEYLAINSKGKVPALRIGDDVLTENAAILYYLHTRYPSAGLLPPEDGQLPKNAPLQDLVWCSSTLHPMTRQVRMPVRYTKGDVEGVKADGIEKWLPILGDLGQRLSGGRWWYGNRWSIVDVYLYWNYSTAASGGLDISSFPALLDHTARVRARPSFQRALRREEDALKERDLQMPPGASL